MDNYLAYRWPGEGPKAPEGAPPRRQKGRVWRNILVCLALLALLAALAAGGWLLSRELLGRWMESLPDDPDGWLWDVPSQSQDINGDMNGGVTAIARAPVGLGVTLELSGEAPALTPQEIYERVLPSVVSVMAQHGENLYSSGSGVIMRSDGYVLTNYHVIEGGSSASVMLLPGGETYEALLVGYDEGYDLAVLKIDAQGLQAASFGDSDTLRVGDAAYAIGNPMGYLYGSMSDGIISAVTRGIKVRENDMTLIQTTAALNSGNSGGALVNAAGQVVGITSAKLSGLSDGVVREGLGLAIPITDLRPFINRILETGKSWRPSIGIMCYAAQADGVSGILVQSVEPGTPAEQAGLTPFDLIVEANGVRVESLYALRRVLYDTGVGGTLRCTVLRDGTRLELEFALIDTME